MPPEQYSPPNPEVADRIHRVAWLFREHERVLAEYRDALTRLVDKEKGDAVPVNYMAELLGVQRKTVYRHTGRPMK